MEGNNKEYSVDFPSNKICPIESAVRPRRIKSKDLKENKKKKLFHVSYETCSELEGMYKAFSKEEAKHLFKKEYRGLPRDFENKIKVREILE